MKQEGGRKMQNGSRRWLAKAGLAIGFLTLLPVAVAAATTPGGPVKNRVLDPGGQIIASPAYEPPTQVISGISCTPSCNLYAKAGTVDVGGQPIPVWGYATAAGGPALVPGPTIVANAGDDLSITVTNLLPSGIATSLSLPRIAVDDFVSGRESVAGSGSSATYVLHTTNAVGTSIYEAGFTATGNRQVAMGLAGALVVRPPAAMCGQPAPPTPAVSCLYGNPNNAQPAPPSPLPYNAKTDVADDEALIALNDLDPAFAADPLGYDMSQYSPSYHLINGKAFPLTDVIDTQAGHVVGLRFANLSPIAHTMGLIGAHQDIVGRDANVLPHGRETVSPLLTPGQTIDASVPVPLAAPAGQRYALYDQGRSLKNGAAPGYGGALTFVNVWGVAGAPGQPVATLDALAIGNPPSDITDGSGFTFTGTNPAGTVDGRWYIDKLPADQTTMKHTTVTDGGGPLTGQVGAVDLAPLDNGSHVVWVQLTNDSNGISWGIPMGVAFSLDRGGPVMSGTSVEPFASNGAVDLTLRTTGSTTATGTANIAEGRYTLNQTCANVPGAGLPFAPDPGPLLNGAPVQGFVATLSAATVFGLGEGTHTAQTAARDTLNHWPTSNPAAGSAALCDQASFVIDTTKPTVSSAVVEPNPTNGTVSTFGHVNFLDSVQLTATVADPLSGVDPADRVNTSIVKVEAFLEGAYPDGTGHQIALPAGAVNGKGFEMQPVDGWWDSPTETAYVYIPLATVRALSPGLHGIWVHGLDKAGNWGAIEGAPSVVLDYEPDAPTVNFLTVNGTILNTGATTAAAGLTVSTIEYSIGAAPAAPGSGTTLPIDAGSSGRVATVTNATIAPHSATLNVWVRAKDNLGHWSSAVALPMVTTALNGSTLTATAVSISDIAGIDYGFTPATSTTPPSSFSTIAASSGVSPVTVPVPNVPAGQMIWLRARDSAGGIGPVIGLPVATNLTFTGPSGNKTLTGIARSATSSIGSVQYVRGAPGPSTAPPTTGWLSPTPASGASPLSFTATGISGGSSSNGNGRIWVRVQDAAGNWGAAVRL